MNRLIASSSSALSCVAGVTMIIAAAVAVVAMNGPLADGVSGITTAATSSEDLVSVNRVNKGDRLSPSSIDRLSHNSTSMESVVPLKRVPLGCDPAFSPFADPALAHIYKRCMA
jgi:hypothetical protein